VSSAALLCLSIFGGCCPKLICFWWCVVAMPHTIMLLLSLFAMNKRAWNVLCWNARGLNDREK
jgi:hypothetical protein